MLGCQEGRKSSRVIRARTSHGYINASHINLHLSTEHIHTWYNIPTAGIFKSWKYTLYLLLHMADCSRFFCSSSCKKTCIICCFFSGELKSGGPLHPTCIICCFFSGELKSGGPLHPSSPSTAQPASFGLLQPREEPRRRRP